LAETTASRWKQKSRLVEACVVEEIRIAGEGMTLTLGVEGYEQPRGGDNWDDNWLRGTASVEVLQPSFAAFQGKCDVAWQTTELHAFHEGLRALLEELTGAATLSTIEDQVGVAIRLKGGKGTIAGRVQAHSVASLEFEAATDQTYLKQTLLDLRAVVSKYPCRD
jgi:hypothetical protein